MQTFEIAGQLVWELLSRRWFGGEHACRTFKVSRLVYQLNWLNIMRWTLNSFLIIWSLNMSIFSVSTDLLTDCFQLHAGGHCHGQAQSHHQPPQRTFLNQETLGSSLASLSGSIFTVFSSLQSRDEALLTLPTISARMCEQLLCLGPACQKILLLLLGNCDLCASSFCHHRSVQPDCVRVTQGREKIGHVPTKSKYLFWGAAITPKPSLKGQDSDHQPLHSHCGHLHPHQPALHGGGVYQTEDCYELAMYTGILQDY